MENEALFKKYPDGHRHDRLASHAEEFSEFLMKCLGYRSIVVDIGCGKGRDTDVFAKHHHMAIGIDNDPEVIYEAKKTAQGHFFVMNAEEMRFPNESVDAFFCINVLHYVDQEKVLKQVSRILQKGGYAFMHFNISIIDENKVTDFMQSPAEIKKLIQPFRLIRKKILERNDLLPLPHTHRILEVVLQKR